MERFNQLKECIQKASYIILAGHISPDGDAIGACVAMGLIVKQMEKKYSILLDRPDAKYNYLLANVHVLTQVPKEKCDLFISLDCGDAQRLGPFKEVFDNAKVTWNIDHHISNPEFAQFNYVDSKASSTSEIVYDIAAEWNLSMDDSIAEAIYTGIVYDTAAFKHSNTTSKTLLTASLLLQYSFDFSTIVQMLFYERSLGATKLQGIATNNITVDYDGALIMSTISQQDISLCNATPQDVEGIVNMLKNIKGSKIAVFLYEKNQNEIKVSMRAEAPYDVCEIAKQLGGGGHTKAAGATIYATLQLAKEQLIDLMKKIFE